MESCRAKKNLNINSFTKILLHFDESAVKDEFGTNWIISGSPTILETNAKFGKSLQLDGESYIQLNKSLTLGGRDFTIDFWGFMSSATAEFGRFFEINTDLSRLEVTRDGIRPRFKLYSNMRDTTDLAIYSQTGTMNALHHVAVVYQHSLSTIKFFLDGTLVGKGSFSLPETVFEKLSIGYSGALKTHYLTGSVNEFRISDGIARWTEDFTPPAEPSV